MTENRKANSNDNLSSHIATSIRTPPTVEELGAVLVALHGRIVNTVGLALVGMTACPESSCCQLQEPLYDHQHHYLEHGSTQWQVAALQSVKSPTGTSSQSSGLHLFHRVATIRLNINATSASSRCGLIGQPGFGLGRLPRSHYPRHGFQGLGLLGQDVTQSRVLPCLATSHQLHHVL